MDKPIVVNPEEALAGLEPSLICAPFLPRGRFCEALDEHLSDAWSDWRQRSSDCLLFAHQEFAGAVMNQTKSVRGDVYESQWPTVISGHIHERQTVGENVIYVGTPWATSHAGDGIKTVSMLDLNCLDRNQVASFLTF